MLLPIDGQFLGQLLRVPGCQIRQVGHPPLQQHLPPFTANTADLAEVPHRRSLPVARAAPTAEGALLAVVHQGRRCGLGQICGETLQALIELMLEATAQGQALLLQGPPRPRQHQRPHACEVLKMIAHERIPKKEDAEESEHRKEQRAEINRRDKHRA